MIFVDELRENTKSLANSQIKCDDHFLARVSPHTPQNTALLDPARYFLFTPSKTFPDLPYSQASNNLAIGLGAGATLRHEHHCILLGRDAEARKSHELVIRFTDGSEFRTDLPEGKEIDLSGLFCDPILTPEGSPS